MKPTKPAVQVSDASADLDRRRPATGRSIPITDSDKSTTGTTLKKWRDEGESLREARSLASRMAYAERNHRGPSG
jgi:hypothetical protein